MIRAPHPRRATLTGRCQNRLTGRAGILQLRGHRGGSLWRRSRSPSPQKPWKGKTEPGGHDSRHPGVLRRAAAPCHGGGRAGLLGAAQLQLRVPLRSLRGAPRGKTAQNWEKRGKKGKRERPKPPARAAFPPNQPPAPPLAARARPHRSPPPPSAARPPPPLTDLTLPAARHGPGGSERRPPAAPGPRSASPPRPGPPGAL